MNGAVTVRTTSVCLSSRIKAKNVRAANSSSEAPRRTSAAFPAIRFLIATTRGRPGPVCAAGNAPGERLHEILFASEEPTREIGVAGIMAAQPNEPPMQTLRKWIAALEQAIARDDRATIRTVLKDAVPEFGSTAA